MNCKPGQQALIVGEEDGCERNIGALITVVESSRDFAAEGDNRVFWTFENPSRDLIIWDYDDCTYYWLSAYHSDAIIADMYLIPIEDPDEQDTKVTKEDFELHN